MASDRTIFDEPHHQSLELLAIEALAEGNAAAAFRFADRRCRILPKPEPHCYVLRGEAAFQMGAHSAAIADIDEALAIDPHNISANRRLLAWAKGPPQIRAARALIGRERNFNALHSPIRILRDAGQDNLASVTVLDETIEGWALWQDQSNLELAVSNEAEAINVVFEPDSFHPLAEYGQATNFTVQRPASARPQSVELSVAGKLLYSARAAANFAEPPLRVIWPQPHHSSEIQVTVIVPVYGDYDATRACLESLLDELRLSGHRAILIDDATPEPRLAKYLSELADDSNLDVLVNARNLGFSGSVNRALAQIEHGDIILLNADTIVPPGFINRLAVAAQSSTDIGTVTPLSNNGEFTSFPLPNVSNPLQPRPSIEAIDALAATANGDEVVDIPSGIGFCLYITRKCLESVGLLSDVFGAGYLEDADFCLRARDKGFRNVCAPSVYVGHAGSKSFGQRKRSLVVHNLGLLERRYPKHRAECGAFIAADPLKMARAAIEQAAAATLGHPTLLITGPGALSTIARARADDIAKETAGALVLEIRQNASGARASLTNAVTAMPQSLQFELAAPDGFAALIEFVKRLKPSRIELLDPARIPLVLVDALLALEIPYDIFIADMGLLGPQACQPVAAAASAHASNGQQQAVATAAGEVEKRWRKLANGANRVLVPCPQAEAFAKRVLPGSTTELLRQPVAKHKPAARKVGKGGACHLGLVPIRPTAAELRLIQAIVAGFADLRPDLSLTVIGTTLDDIGLMRGGNVFVTGAVDPDEFPKVVKNYGVQSLFLCAARPLFGHPFERAARAASLPIAYFDWSKIGQAKKNDLAIDPNFALDNLIGALGRWMAKS